MADPLDVEALAREASRQARQLSMYPSMRDIAAAIASVFGPAIAERDAEVERLRALVAEPAEFLVRVIEYLEPRLDVDQQGDPARWVANTEAGLYQEAVDLLARVQAEREAHVSKGA